MSLSRGYGDAERICEECGDDLACEGHRFCSECLESIYWESDPTPDFFCVGISGRTR
jgi:hypothetical protein